MDFLKFHEMGLVERRIAPVNWCDSCDTVLDVDGDGMPNYIEERYGTSPWDLDSDGDLIGDEVEVAFGQIQINTFCGNTVNSMSEQ